MHVLFVQFSGKFEAFKYFPFEEQHAAALLNKTEIEKVDVDRNRPLDNRNNREGSGAPAPMLEAVYDDRKSSSITSYAVNTAVNTAGNPVFGNSSFSNSLRPPFHRIENKCFTNDQFQDFRCNNIHRSYRYQNINYYDHSYSHNQRYSHNNNHHFYNNNLGKPNYTRRHYNHYNNHIDNYI